MYLECYRWRVGCAAVSLAVAVWLQLALTAQPAGLRVDYQAGLARLEFNGDSGQDYQVDASSNLATPTWRPLLNLTMPSQSPSWLDADSQSVPSRFYRLVKLDAPIFSLPVDDFRLLDHQGKSHDLYYHTEAKAIVLVLIGNDPTNAITILPALKTLRSQFAGKGLLFWWVQTAPAADRDQVAAKAAAFGIDFPILQDNAELIARGFGATAIPEIVCVRTTDWTVFYRGAIESKVTLDTQPVAQNYLADTLQSFLNNQPLWLRRTAAGGPALSVTPQPPADYSHDIAPLLQQHCVICHRPNDIAPWAMTNHANVRAYAASMKNKVLTGQMPPWHADPQYGSFSNDASLQPGEARRLIQWIDAGAPRGDGPDPLVDNPPVPGSDWPLGPPDYIVTIPKQNIPATGVLEYRYLFVNNPIPTNAWLRGIAIRPGNRQVIHHCLVFPGSAPFDFSLNGSIAAYSPGKAPELFPAGTGIYLAKGGSFGFQMHYTTMGADATDETQLGFYLSTNQPLVAYKSGTVLDFLFMIPAGAGDYERVASYTFAKPARIYELSPHMHLRGHRMKFEVLYPNQKREVLLSVPDYEFHWQLNYRLTQPKDIPAGSRMICTAGYDNSPQNLANPDPGKVVTWGEQSFNEMFIGFFSYTDIQ